MRTRAGKTEGIGKRDFYEEGAKLVNCTIPDPTRHALLPGTWNGKSKRKMKRKPAGK
jgi:hypothetical protein